MLARAWIAAHRARWRLMRSRGDGFDIVREYAPGRSFLDVGCLWGVHGRYAFTAEEAGATAVTGIDIIGATPEFEAERAERGSEVRLVEGDLTDAAVLAEAGKHDVVWCSGVLYHTPNPVLTLERLREVTGSWLLLSSQILPDVPGLPGAAVLYPALDDAGRRAFAGTTLGPALGLTRPYDAAGGYSNWFWGITPSALDGLLRVAGFGPVERRWRASPFHLTVAARPART